MTRTEAIAAGLKKYISNTPCRFGHLERTTDSGNCVECKKATAHRWMYNSGDKAQLEARAAGKKTYLSDIFCKDGHTERYTSNRKCVTCAAEYNIARYDKRRIGGGEKIKSWKLTYTKAVSNAVERNPNAKFGPFFAYLVTNDINVRQYIGIGRDVAARWRDHLRVARGASGFGLQRAIRRYGKENFLVEIIACSVTWDDITATEKVLIAQYGTFSGDGSGYNMTRGGEGTVGVSVRGRRHSDTARAKMSEAATGRIMPRDAVERTRQANLGSKHTAEQTEKMAAKLRGRAHPPFTQEARDKMSASQRARRARDMPPVTDAHRAAISKGLMGHKLSDETKAKIGNANRGKQRSEVTKKKLSKAGVGRVATDVARAKLSASMKARWEQKRVKLQKELDDDPTQVSWRVVNLACDADHDK